MRDVDALISLIHDGSNNEALAMLEISPELAAAHSDLDGQMQGASPLHWASHRNVLQVCECLIQLGASIEAPR